MKKANWISKGIAKFDKKAYSVNLTKMGIDKLLGSGRIKQGITIGKCTQSAKEKVEESGGRVISAEMQ